MLALVHPGVVEARGDKKSEAAAFKQTIKLIE